MTSLPKRRLILVTGSPRSGTTAVGEFLGLAPKTGVLHEPLNYHVGLTSVQRYFEVVGSGSITVDELEHIVQGIESLRLAYKPGVFPGDKGLRRVVKYALGGRALNSYRRCRLTPGLDNVVWKDPFAVFLVDALADLRDLDVVVTVRNPWAVAASFQRLGWSFDLTDLWQRLEGAGVPLPVVDMPRVELGSAPALNGALLWTMAYHALATWAQHSERIRFLNVDALVERPVEMLGRLFDDLDLVWSANTEQAVRKTYRVKDAPVVPRADRPFDRARDLTQAHDYWRDLLSDEHIELIDDLTAATRDRISEVTAEEPA